MGLGYASTIQQSSPSNVSIIVQSILTNTAINSTMFPIDIENISNKMANAFKEVQSVTIKLLEFTAIPTLNAENLLKLLSVVHDNFDVIIGTSRGLEHKLNGIIGVVDLPMINIQVALQTLIQTIVVNVIITTDTSNTTQNDINYSVLGVVDGIQLLLDTAYSLLSGIVTLPGNDLAKSMLCLEGIVQTILSITENLLHSLRKFLSNFKIDSIDGFIMPKLEVALTNSLNKLARNVTHPVTSIVKESLEPTLLSIIVKLKGNLSSVTESSLNLIKNISNPINDLLITIVDNQNIATKTLTMIPSITRTIPSSMLSISNEIKSLHGNTIGVQSTFNVALSNTIASLRSLSSYLSLITTYGFTTGDDVAVDNTPKLLSDTQMVLLLLATNIQTLTDTATQAVSQSIIYSMRPKNLREIVEQRDALKESVMKIPLLLENIVKIHMRAMQTLLSGVSVALRKVLTDYSESLVLVAVNIKHCRGDLGNVIEDMLTGSIGNISTDSTGRLNDAVKAFKMVVDNVDNFRVNVRNTFKAIDSFV